MRLRLQTRRLLLGLHGLALLRGWPFGDAAEAAENMDMMRGILSGHADPDPPEVEVDHPGLQAAYRSWSDTYDEMWNGLIEIEEPVLRAALSSMEPGNALDAACGTGRVSAILADRGHDVVAIDASPEILDRAKAKGIPARFELGDLEHLPLDDQSVDLAVASLALTHSPSLDEVFAELTRVVRTGGRIVLSDVHPMAVATGAQGFFRRADGSRVVVVNHVHWASAYVNVAVAQGLRIERCEEVPVDEPFMSQMGDEAIRLAAHGALIGLPLVLIWVMRKP